MNVFFLTLFQGYTHPREYIVTEWPLPTTCSDIWSLVYDHDCSAVVVLCNPTSTVSNVSRLSHDVSSMYSFQDSGEKNSRYHINLVSETFTFSLVVYIDYRAKKLHYGFVGIVVHVKSTLSVGPGSIPTTSLVSRLSFEKTVTFFAPHLLSSVLEYFQVFEEC